jgi:hypothetical protein
MYIDHNNLSDLRSSDNSKFNWLIY